MAKKKPAPAKLVYPWPAPPEPFQLIEIAPGILWFRLALPFQLNHVNLYLIEDQGGWLLVDTGLGNKATQKAWDALLAGPLKAFRITGILVTHFHPDHVGAAGFLLKRFDVPIYMSATEYLQSLNLHLDPAALEAPHYRAFYARHGLDAETVENVVTKGHEYLRLVSGLPPTFRRMIAGDTMRIGGRTFEVMSGGGHSPEQIMLFSRADGLFFAADQVLAQITPNVSVHAMDPLGDPLGIYLRSLASIKEAVPKDALVLPGHQLPFRGLHARADELARHHHVRCAGIEAACKVAARSAADLIPFVFHRALDPHQIGFAFSEILAHVNYMLRQGSLESAQGADGITRFTAPS